MVANVGSGSSAIQIPKVTQLMIYYTYIRTLQKVVRINCLMDVIKCPLNPTP